MTTWLTLYYRFHVIAVENGCTSYAVISNLGLYYHHHSSIPVQNVHRHLQRTLNFNGCFMWLCHIYSYVVSILIPSISSQLLTVNEKLIKQKEKNNFL